MRIVFYPYGDMTQPMPNRQPTLKNYSSTLRYYSDKPENKAKIYKENQGMLMMK